MELTIEQALQQGVAAHKEGKLQDAEHLYRAILQSQPSHSDANHNLGVLAVSVNKADAALPLFKTALEANPKMEQFWLSYIDALIKEKQFDNAKQVLEQAKKQGVAGEKLNALEKQLFPEAQIQNVVSASPPQEKLSRLLEHYQNGRFSDAEKLATSISHEFPSHNFSWKILGAVFKATDRNSEAVNANQTAVALSPQDSEAHYNLGVTLKEPERLDEAETSFKQAIALKPDFAEAHSNLGVMLQELGRLDEALASLRQAIALKPDLAEPHYNLGITLQELGRLDEAEASYTQAIALKPGHAEAHNNLGNTLKELGRLDEAEASYAQAIALKPDYAEAHSNLGITLQELGRLDEAEASYTQAIALKPGHAEAHNNLGNTLKELGRLDEAEASYAQAIALKPDYAEAHSNLGITLQELGRLDEAEASYTQAIALKPDFAEAMLNISVTQSHMNNLEAEIVSLKNILRIDSTNYGLRAGVNLAICNFLEGDFAESKKLLLAATKIQEKLSSASKNERVYWRYLSNILKWHENKYIANKKEKNDKTLYVIGESHSLTSHHLRIQSSEIDFFCSARLIKGCKQWHLGNTFRNRYKHQFESIFCALPKHSYVLLAIGEIDCRLETGIIAHKKKFPEKQLKEIILTTVGNYLIYIVNNNSDCQHKVIIQGVPCPNIDIRNCSQKDIKQLVEVIKIFNYELKVQSKEKGFRFLDTYQLTNKGDGLSTGFWHMDDYHLSPEGMQEAWRRYSAENSYVQY
ncbi:tetratricopeptide repeat protein [Porticoccaceae bacterium]|nr:tetratricopeptide repeat protein [Porticoccaceae bacterium]